MTREDWSKFIERLDSSEPKTERKPTPKPFPEPTTKISTSVEICRYCANTFLPVNRPMDCRAFQGPCIGMRENIT
jgi:hypothetical protein